MQTMIGTRRDFVLTKLCEQIEHLRSVLKYIKQSKPVEDSFADNSLKEVESNLRKIRKLCVEH